MASGVTVSTECTEKYHKVKRISAKKEKFVVYKLSDNFEKIVVDPEFQGEESITLPDLVKKLPEDKGRYVLYDYGFKSSAGGDASKLVILIWAPSKSPIKQRMLYASSKDALKKIFEEDVPEIQCDCPEDVCDDDILCKVGAKR